MASRDDEFRVYDNGVRSNIENLWLEADLPLTLGVIIGASESQHEQLAEHRQAALGLLDQILQPGDQAFVISVDSKLRLWANLQRRRRIYTNSWLDGRATGLGNIDTDRRIREGQHAHLASGSGRKTRLAL
jgi:hypothetical protein